MFERFGEAAAFTPLEQCASPGSCITLVGMPLGPVEIDIVALQARKLLMETVFLYANFFDCPLC